MATFKVCQYFQKKTTPIPAKPKVPAGKDVLAERLYDWEANFIGVYLCTFVVKFLKNSSDQMGDTQAHANRGKFCRSNLEN